MRTMAYGSPVFKRVNVALHWLHSTCPRHSYNDLSAMTPKILVVTVALVASLTYVRPEKLTLSQVDAFDFPFYHGRSFNPAFPAATGLTFSKNDGVVQPRVLGAIDFLLLNRLSARMNQLEEAMKNLIENSQATADHLASIKSDLSTLKNTVDETKNEVATIKVDLGTITATADDLASVKSDLSKLKDTVDETKNEVAAIQVNLGTITVATDQITAIAANLTKLNDTINANSQATANDLASIKSHLSTLQEVVDGTKSDVGTIQTNLETLTVVTDRIPAIAANLTKLNDTVTIISKPTSIGGIPTSCDDLSKLGNIKSGLYNIKSSGKIDAVYCDFTLESTQQGFQIRVGFLNAQTLPVYFYVQKDMPAFGTVDKIPFEIESLNVGGAMDIQTGIFTAPVDGTYFFAFSGVIFVTVTQQIKAYLMFLKHNGNNAAQIGFQDSSLGSELAISLHLEATLKLKKNDQVWLSSYVSDNALLLIGSTFSSFTGTLLAEEIPLLQ